MTVAFEAAEEVDEATQAFEDLRTEIAGLRRAVEALGPTTETGRAPDYSPTLGAMAKTLQAATVRIDAVAKHTGANLAPEIARRMMVNRTPTPRDQTFRQRYDGQSYPHTAGSNISAAFDGVYPDVKKTVVFLATRETLKVACLNAMTSQTDLGANRVRCPSRHQRPPSRSRFPRRSCHR